MNSRIITVKKIVIITFCLFFLVTPEFFALTYGATQIEITVNQSNIVNTNHFSTGFQLDGPDIRKWLESSELQQLAEEANFKLVRFFEHRLGKACTYWDERTKTGQWDWDDIDQLVEHVFEIGAEPLIALGFVGYDTRRLTSVPNGMSYNLETGLPYPDQWAAYCSEWVKHFKEKGYPVRYYEMINEAYHYFDWPATQPRLGYFMELYNAAYKSMKAVNNNIMIGNDACVISSVLDYFISNGENLDFLSYHAYGTSTLSAADEEIFQAAETKYVVETRTVYGVEKTRQLYKTARGIDLPVIHAENNVNFYFTQGTDPRIQKMQGAVYNALCFRTSMLNGYYYTSYFHFASSADSNEYDPSGGLGFGMVNSDDNQPWYPYYANKLVGTNLDVGDPIIDSQSSSDDIRSVAWINNGKLNLLLVCKVDQQREISLTGINGYLNYYKLDNSVSWRTPRIQTGTINTNVPLTINGYTVILLQSNISVSPPSSDDDPVVPPGVDVDTDVLFEDDFESHSFVAWTSTSESSGETTSVVDYAAYVGNYGARFSSSGSGGYEKAFAYEELSGINSVNMRAYFRLPQEGLTDSGDRLKLVEYRAGSSIIAAAGLWQRSGTVYWWMESRDGSNYVETISSPVSIDVSDWFSLELRWKTGASDGEASLWVNGNRIYDINNADTNNYGGCSQVKIGIAEAYNCEPIIVYADQTKLSNDAISVSPPSSDDDPVVPPGVDVDTDVLFEDDFESHSFVAWTSTSESSGETTSVVDYAAYVGNYGARFSSSGSGGYEKAFAYEELSGINSVNMRAYFRLPQEGLTDSGDRLKLVEYRAGSSIIAAAGLWQRSGTVYWWMESRDGSNYVETISSPVSIDVSDWFSLELRWKTGASDGEASLWVNGNRIYDINNADTNNYGGCSQVKIGIAEAYNCEPIIVYADQTKLSNP